MHAVIHKHASCTFFDCMWQLNPLPTGKNDDINEKWLHGDLSLHAAQEAGKDRRSKPGACIFWFIAISDYDISITCVWK